MPSTHPGTEPCSAVIQTIILPDITGRYTGAAPTGPGNATPAGAPGRDLSGVEVLKENIHWDNRKCRAALATIVMGPTVIMADRITAGNDGAAVTIRAAATEEDSSLFLF